MDIKRYEPKDEAALFDLLRSEGEAWAGYFSPATMEQYKAALQNSITYVLYVSNTLCGYIRVRDDDGFGIYIYDLLVNQNHRGKEYGRLVMEQVCRDFPGNTIYVMSDVDGYYEKLGYRREGTVFEVIAKGQPPVK